MHHRPTVTLVSFDPFLVLTSIPSFPTLIEVPSGFSQLLEQEYHFNSGFSWLCCFSSLQETIAKIESIPRNIDVFFIYF
jgi:hypothetical protein